MKGSQKRYRRGLAHSIKPAVQIGKGGLTDTVAESIDLALQAHELIKIQIFADREERKALAEAVAERLECSWAGGTGRMAIFYRQHPDDDKRKIELPG